VTHAAQITAGEVDQERQGGAVHVRGAERDRVRLSLLQVQVRGMLPGEAHTAVRLHAFLRGVHRDLRAVRLGRRHRDGAYGHVVGQVQAAGPDGKYVPSAMRPRAA
jgi:hypothetical protein